MHPTSNFSVDSQESRSARREEDRLRRDHEARSLKRQREEQTRFNRPALFGPPIKVSSPLVSTLCNNKIDPEGPFHMEKNWM